MFNYLKSGKRHLELDSVNGIHRVARVANGKVVCEFKTNNRISALQYWKASVVWLRKG